MSAVSIVAVLCKLRGLAKVYEAQSHALSGEQGVMTATFTFPNERAAEAFRQRALLEAQHFDPVAPIYEWGGVFWVDVSLFPRETKPYDAAGDAAELEADHLRDTRGAS